MKIFLSYGHDRNTPIVLRIKHDLEAAGHLVWIDSAEIKGGDDWRRSIVDGLMDTDWTLGFLSRHSVRSPGVCLDELAIALHVKGGTIATVLVESEAAVEPPISVSHIQRFDMHDWAERMADKSEAGEKWYSSKLNEILFALADPKAERFGGELKELDRLLGPISQENEIGARVDGFVGRAWLRSALDDWCKNARESRLFWISGAPGTGKSTFAASLAHKSRLNVIAVNFCRYNVEEQCDPARVVCTLAFQIATRLSDFRRFLLDRLQKEGLKSVELHAKPVPVLFDRLLVEPLRFAIDGGRQRERFLVIIDALDETIRGGRSALTEVLAESCYKLPDWVAVVVTSRPEPSILRQFAGLKPQIIETESLENLNDCRAFVRRWLAIESLGAGETEARVDRIIAASRGNFLFVRMLRDAVSAGLMGLEQPDALPLGLVGLYERWFRRQFPSAAAYADCRSFFEVLAAAEHPVPESWFERIFGWSKQDQAKVFEQVGSLVERRADGVLPFHKSLLDWLIDDSRAGADFIIDPKVGARCLQSALWTEFLAWIEQPGNVRLDPFCRDELLVQLTGTNGEPGQLREFARVLGDPEIIRRRMLVGTAASEDTRRQARHAFAELVWQSASVWPKGVDAAPLQECAIAMANVAWETWEALRSRRLKPQPPHYNEPSECIFLLVTAVRIAWVLRLYRSCSING
jgi:hypothetical protein